MTIHLLVRHGIGVRSTSQVAKLVEGFHARTRTCCLCGLHTYTRNKHLLTVTIGSMMQKRFKVPEQRSNINLWNARREGLPRKESLIDEISDGLEIIKKGIPEFKQEMLDKLYLDPNFCREHGDFEYFHRFNGEDSLKNWLLSTDQDTDQGKSRAAFTVSPSNKALFHGCLNTDVPKDGISKRAGYCNIRSPYKKISFDRRIPYDWHQYTHLYLRVRGDGRNYMLIVQMDRHFDIHVHDMYNYPLYTRGGPYWQVVKIPLSSFYLAFQGRAQDMQELVSLDKIKFFSITAGDGIPGPFRLEIDYIALVKDDLADNRRDFKYELYQKKPRDV